MGYTTEFEGELKFTEEVRVTDLAILRKILGEDRRDHPEWAKEFPYVDDFYYLDLALTDDFSGLEWSGAEKSYSMEKQVQFVMDYLRKGNPDFGLTGEFLAQGEESKDRWILQIQDGRAVRVDQELTGRWIECPHCGEEFELEED